MAELSGMQNQSNGGCTGFHKEKKKKKNFIPQILEVVFFTNKKEGNTICCMICFYLLVLHSMFVLQMSCYVHSVKIPGTTTS